MSEDTCLVRREFDLRSTPRMPGLQVAGTGGAQKPDVAASDATFFNKCR